MSPQAPFLTDRPEALASDAFGHRDYTDALYSIVAGNSPPPTVGIFGPWGVGKSTIIGGLQEKVAATEAAFVYFDAWRYEEDSLRRQFLLDAAADLKSAGKLDSYDPAKELRDLELDTQELQRSLGLSWRHLVRSAILALILGAAAFLAAEAGLFDAWLDGTFGEKVKLAAVTAGLTLLVGALSQTVSVDTLAMSRRSLSDPDRFEEKFRDLLAALRPKRLIVAVDNLDRCSPEKAVELLATIKTYLEPSAGAGPLPRSAARKDSGKEVIFVLAVDDEALRRHLIAQESERSEGAEPAEVRHYVEEYLAKFFGARLPIRPILGEDMRSYVAARIAPLARARKLPDAEEKSLVSVVDAGLRGNPRGVKQFYNDLEVRLRLLEERESEKGERGPAIHPPVSGEVAMVAKLALIEREWPEAFARLERDPRLLARWTLAARRDPEVAWDGPEAAGPNPTGAPSRRAFATFLRRSARVESASLAALLSLKQSAIEVELPGFAEFREALTAGDRVAVADFLGDAAPDERQRLAARVPEILGEELDRGYPDSAAAVLDVVANVEVLASAGEVRRDVIRVAAEDPDLRGELVRLDAAPVLALGTLLGGPECHLLLGPFIVRYHDLNVGEEEREGLAEVLADHLPEMAEEQRRGLQGLIGGGIREQFGVYLPLVRADPALLASQAIDAAIAELGKSRPGSPDPVSPAPFAESAPGALSVVKLAVRRSLGPAHAERVAGVCAALLGILGPSFATFKSELRDMRVLLEPLELPGSARWNEMADSLEVRWGELFTEDAAALLGLASVILPRCLEGRGAEVASFIASRIFEDPGHGLALLERLDEPAEIFRDPLLENLRPLVGSDQHWEAAGEAIMRLGIETPQAPLINGFCELYRLGAYPQARDLLNRYADLLEPHSDELAAAAVGLLADRAEAGEPGPGDLVGRLAAMMDAGPLDQLATRLADVLTGPFAEEARAAIEEAAAVDRGRLRAESAHHALARIDDSQPPPSAALVSLISAAAADLTGEAQEHFAEQIALRLRNFPGQVPDLLAPLRLAGGLPAEPAKTIADPLLERERSESVDVAFRIELLRTATALRVRRGTRVSHELEARLGELKTSGADEDRAVAVELHDLLGG